MIINAGFGWATRTIALLLFITLVIPTVSLQKRTPTSSRRRFLDPVALREPSFVLCMSSMLIAFIGLYIPYFYIEVFALRRNVLNSDQKYLTKYLIVIMNVGSLVGRLVRYPSHGRSLTVLTTSLLRLSYQTSLLTTSALGIRSSLRLLSLDY